MKKTIYSLTLLLAIQPVTGLISTPDALGESAQQFALEQERAKAIINWIQRPQNQQIPRYNLQPIEEIRLNRTFENLEKKQKSNIRLLNVLKTTISLGTIFVITGQLLNFTKNEFNHSTIGLALAGLGLGIYGSQMINKSLQKPQSVINNIKTFKNLNFKDQL